MFERATLLCISRRQNLFGLSTRKVYHTSNVTIEVVGSYPTFSPLSRLWRDGIFSVALSVPDRIGTFPLGSTALYVARTFLPDIIEAIRKPAFISKIRRYSVLVLIN